MSNKTKQETNKGNIFTRLLESRAVFIAGSLAIVLILIIGVIFVLNNNEDTGTQKLDAADSDQVDTLKADELIDTPNQSSLDDGDTIKDNDKDKEPDQSSEKADSGTPRSIRLAKTDVILEASEIIIKANNKIFTPAGKKVVQKDFVDGQTIYNPQNVYTPIDNAVTQNAETGETYQSDKRNSAVINDGILVLNSDSIDSGDYGTLEITWFEHGSEMTLYFYLRSDGDSWKITQLRTNDGSHISAGQVRFNPDISAKVGEPITGDYELALFRSSGDQDQASTLIMKDLKLSAPGFTGTIINKANSEESDGE